MPTHMKIALPTQLDSSMEVPLSVDATNEAEYVQNAWSNDCKPSASQTSPSFALEAPIHPTVDSSTTPDANKPETTELDNEEHGEFVQASTDPLKRPVYDTTEENDETLGLLNSKSGSVWEAESYIGMGMVEPVQAAIGMKMLRVKKMARWKRNDIRANMIVAEWKRKRTQMTGCVAISIPVATAAPSSAEDGLTQPVATPIKTISNQYLQAPRVTTSTSDMNGVMRPVRFAGSAIDEMVETERTAWGP